MYAIINNIVSMIIIWEMYKKINIGPRGGGSGDGRGSAEIRRSFMKSHCIMSCTLRILQSILLLILKSICFFLGLFLKILNKGVNVKCTEKSFKIGLPNFLFALMYTHCITKLTEIQIPVHWILNKIKFLRSGIEKEKFSMIFNQISWFF